MITLTTEQAQQIEEALEDIVRVFKFETGTPVEALAVIREQKAKLEKQEPVAWKKCAFCGIEHQIKSDGYILDTKTDEVFCRKCYVHTHEQEPVGNRIVGNDADGYTVENLYASPQSVNWSDRAVQIRALQAIGAEWYDGKIRNQWIADTCHELTKVIGGAAPVHQAEQKPVAVISESAIGLVKLHSNGVSLPFGTDLYAAPQPVEQEPVAIDGLARACNLAGIDYKDFLRIKAYLPIAAPVRTKDLTEQEIQDAIINISPTGTGYFLRIARAVIQEYRRKNGIV